MRSSPTRTAWYVLSAPLRINVLLWGLSACDGLRETLEILTPIVDRTIELEAMTCNIYRENSGDPEDQAWANRREQVVANILEIRPDVLGVQEAYRSQVDYLLSQMPDYGWYGVGRDDGATQGEHAAIFYISPRILVTWTPMTKSAGPRKQGAPVAAGHQAARSASTMSLPIPWLS